jgi:hypothetical protein
MKKLILISVILAISIIRFSQESQKDSIISNYTKEIVRKDSIIDALYYKLGEIELQEMKALTQKDKWTKYIKNNRDIFKSSNALYDEMIIKLKIEAEEIEMIIKR